MNRWNVRLFSARIVGALVASLVLAPCVHVWGFAGYGDLWAEFYPASASGNASCALCHNGFILNQWNAYGWDIRLGLDARLSISGAIRAAEAIDSDGEGSTNLEEINANTQPGWTYGPNNTIYKGIGNSQPNQPPPPGIPGDLDPPGAPPDNVPPIADPDGPYSGDAGQPILFDGSGSSDVDGTIVSYDWDFDDGNRGTGVAPTHTYAAPGTYNVTLTVTDDGGLTDTATTIAVVRAVNQPPVAVPGGPYAGTPGQPVQFDGTASYDPDGEIFAYLWDFGDGDTGLGPTPTHTYSDVGTYTVTLRVVDFDGEVGSATTTAVVTPDRPGRSVWLVRLPYLELEFEVAFEDGGGLLEVEETLPDERVIPGIGIENNGFIIWFDVLGTIFYGSVNQNAGTMMGVVYNLFGGDVNTVWFAERL